MKKEILKHLEEVEKEGKVDEKSWNDLVNEKFAEAKNRKLPSRFVHRKQGAGIYFTILEKDNLIIVFENKVLNLKKGEFVSSNQAIVLEEGREPRLVFNVELESYWMKGKREEELNSIGFSYYYLKKAELFDSRKSNYRWKGLAPDVQGVLNAREYPKEG